jgi:hypothetical protein
MSNDDPGGATRPNDTRAALEQAEPVVLEENPMAVAGARRAHDRRPDDRMEPRAGTANGHDAETHEFVSMALEQRAKSRRL